LFAAALIDDFMSRVQTAVRPLGFADDASWKAFAGTILEQLKQAKESSKSDGQVALDQLKQISCQDVQKLADVTLENLPKDAAVAAIRAQLTTASNAAMKGDAQTATAEYQAAVTAWQSWAEGAGGHMQDGPGLTLAQAPMPAASVAPLP